MDILRKDTRIVRATFTESLLGTLPVADVASRYLTPKDEAMPSDELETLAGNLEQGTTSFHKLPDGTPILYDYQVKGFLKEAANTFNGMLMDIKGARSKVDKYVFIYPRRIVIHLAEGTTIGFLERPLRAETMQGPRVCLARSEEIAAGSWIEFQIGLYPSKDITWAYLQALMPYGEEKGLGQWRNGSHGRFSAEWLLGNEVIDR